MGPQKIAPQTKRSSSSDATKVPLYYNKKRAPPSSLRSQLRSSPVQSLLRRQSQSSASSVASLPTAAIITSNAQAKPCFCLSGRATPGVRLRLTPSPASQGGNNHKTTATSYPLHPFRSSLALFAVPPQCGGTHANKDAPHFTSSRGSSPLVYRQGKKRK